MPVLQVKTFRVKAGKVENSHYKVTVSRLRARIANAMNYNTLKGDMRIEGFPDVSLEQVTKKLGFFLLNEISFSLQIRIAMNSVGAIKPIDQDEQQLQAQISDSLSRALRETIYPVDFSMYTTCPRADIEPLDLPVIYPIPYDNMAVSVRTLRSDISCLMTRVILINMTHSFRFLYSSYLKIFCYICGALEAVFPLFHVYCSSLNGFCLFVVFLTV